MFCGDEGLRICASLALANYAKLEDWMKWCHGSSVVILSVVGTSLQEWWTVTATEVGTATAHKSKIPAVLRRYFRSHQQTLQS